MGCKGVSRTIPVVLSFVAVLLTSVTSCYGSGADTEPAAVSATASTSATVLASPPTGTTVAYIYASDSSAGGSFKSLLEAGGHAVTLIPMSGLAQANLSSFGLIIVGNDTGYGYSWGDTASVSLIHSSGKPIIALGYGGSCLFQQLGLSINWGNGWVGPLTQLYVVDTANTIFRSPYSIAIPENRILQLYSASDHIGEYAGYISSSVLLLGREPEDLEHYPVVQEGHNILWGFTASPANMSDDGKLVFLNVVALAASLPADTLPDLVVTDFWREGGRIFYQIMNVGQATATRGHVTSLSFDGVLVARNLEEQDLAPGQRLTRSFDYNWVSSVISNTIAVTADYLGTTVESDETNNSSSAVWKYDETAPRITFGPQVSGVTQGSATISWGTDESSDGLVRYGAEAGVYSAERGDSSIGTNHSITLLDLFPAASYHFVVRSTDASGNVVETQDLWFQTLPRADTPAPTLSLADFGVLSGISRLSATASESAQKVEFVIDGALAFTAYGPPFEFVADTAKLANGNHNLSINAVNSAGTTAVLNRTFTINNVNPDAPTVKILSPASGETVSGSVTVIVQANVKTGLPHLVLDVDSHPMSGMDFPLPYPTGGIYQLTLDTLAISEAWCYGGCGGHHRLGVYTYGSPTQPLWAGDTVDIIVVNTPQPPPPKLVVTSHRATRKGNYFTIDVTVQNVGGDVASNVVLKDNLILFQPILSTGPLYDVSTDLGGYNLGTQNAIIKGKVDIPPGQSIDYAFDAVPVMAYPGGVYPYIGNSDIEISWSVPHQSWPGSCSVSIPVEQTTDGEPLGQAFDSATHTSDYLIVTSPENLMRFNYKGDVAALVSKMAELARLKNGVLGYLDVASSIAMTYDPNDGFAVGDVAGDDKGEIVIADHAKGEIHVYGLQSDVSMLYPLGQWPPLAWKEYAHFWCGENFVTGDKIAVGKGLGKTKRQIVVAHGIGSIDICEDWTPNLLTPAPVGTFVFGPLVTGGKFSANFHSGDGLAVGDVNGDGNDEIVVASAGDHTLYIYSGAGVKLNQFALSYAAGDGLAVGDVLGTGTKQIILASAGSQAVSILSGAGSPLNSFTKDFHSGDGLAVGKPVASFGDNKDEIVFGESFGSKVSVWKKGTGSADWGEIELFSRLVQPNYGLAVGNVFGGQSDDVVIADWTQKSIDFMHGSEGSTEKHILQGLVQASYGSWSARLRSDWTSNGYMLIVGEPEIVPAYGGKTFGQALTTDGWQDITVEVTDYPYASTSGTEIRPELSIGRIVGNSALELIKPIQTSIEAAKKIPGYGFNAQTTFTVSGFPGAPPNNIDFESEMLSVAQILKDKGLDGLAMIDTNYGVYDALGQFDKPATDAIIVPLFFANTSGKDIIFLAGHGSSGSWDAIKASDVMARTAPFGSTSPFVFASSCSTGMYFIPGSLVEAFLQRGAGAYLGATKWGLGSGDWVAKSFFEQWNMQQEPVGLAVKKVKQSIGDQQGDYWKAIYHVFGDPKFGASGAVGLAAPQVYAPVPSTATVTVPEYQVTQLNGIDHVTIPGGQVLAVPGMPEVPSYRIFYDIPKGQQVQGVSLQSKSDPISATGLNVATTSMAVVGQDLDTGDRISQARPVDWWPHRRFDWSVIEGPDNDTLAITVYPFDYNARTTDARFYRNYTFTISSIQSNINLTRLAMDKESYVPGEPVNAVIALENSGTGAKDVTVSTQVKSEATGEVVGGLPLRTLKGLKGRASHAGTWNSAGMPSGYYSVLVELRDAEGTLLGHKTRTFRLDSPAGEISQLTVTPRVFNIGNNVSISLSFKNVGSSNISGFAMIRVLDASRNPVAQFSHDIAALAPADTIVFGDVWSTAQTSPGSYSVAGFVLYDGRTSRTAEVPIESNTPQAEAGPDQIVERSGPDGARVTLDGSKSHIPSGLPLSYAWSWVGGGAVGVNPTVSLPMGSTVVTLNVSSGGASASDIVNIRVVDITPPTVQIKLPASGEAIQDSPAIAADCADLSGVYGMNFWIRGPLGLKGPSLGYDAMPGTLKSGTAESGSWAVQFKSTGLPDGQYVVLAKAVDNYGNEAWSKVLPFSIRNWAVFQMLPATPDSNAGRTMPVKFSLRISQAVDPAQPFVHNEQLTVRISGGGQVLQTSVFGSKAADYRIDDQGRQYITNFQTLKTPMQYTVEVLHGSTLVGSFNFATTK